MGSVVTLLTDFGTADSYVAETKAALLAVAPAVRLIDITHEIAQGDLRAAQYLFARTWHRFPSGAVHLVIVDPGVGTGRRALAAQCRGHSFVGPDNGVLTPVLDGAEIVTLRVQAGAAPTFHGRDVFAPVAGRLANGEALMTLGAPIADPVRLEVLKPATNGSALAGEIVHVDRFGTLVSDIPSDAVGGVAEVMLEGYGAVPLGRTFSDVAVGSLVAFAGSADTIEIAARNSSAAQVTGVGVGARVSVALRP